MWYLVSLVTHLNKPRFLGIVFASTSLKKIQVKSSMNTRELKWLSLWQTTAEYLQKKPPLFTSYFHRSNDRAKINNWGWIKTLSFFRQYGLMTWSHLDDSHLGGIDQKSCSFCFRWGTGKKLKLIESCWSTSSDLLPNYL